MELQQVGDGVWACLQVRPGLGWSNSGLVEADGGFAVDTFYDLPLTRGLISEYAGVVGDVPRRLLNTHHNGDHCWGNQLFAEAGTEIIGHRECASRVGTDLDPKLAVALQEAAPGTLPPHLERLAHDYRHFDFHGVEPTPPTTLLDGDERLDLDGTAADLLFVGPAHTAGDVVAWLPEQSVLFTGDVLFHGCTPIGWEGTFGQWIERLERLEALEPDTVVPGHGPVCGVDGLRAERESISETLVRDFDSAAVQSNETGVTVFVTDSTFLQNGVNNPAAGGAVSSNGGIDVSGSSFIGNQAANGSALRGGDGTIDVDTSTFYENHVASPIGSATYSIDLDANVSNNHVELSHVTLWSNTRTSASPAANVDTPGSLTSFASIIGQPTTGDSCIVGTTTTSEGFNLDRGDSCGFGAGEADAEDVSNIGLTTLSDGDGPAEQVLVPGFLSPAVDRIPNGDCVGTIIDQVGQVRPKDGDFDGAAACDVGAVERPLLPVFTDMSVAHPFFEEIGWMGWQQISTGTLPGPAYKPSDPVSRQAMSAFLYRLADASWVPGAPTFPDVPASNPFFTEIEWMNAAEITGGSPVGCSSPPRR